MSLHLRRTSTVVECLDKMVQFKNQCDFGNFILYSAMENNF